MKTIIPNTVLDYYDGIQIFTANDASGGQYIGFRRTCMIWSEKLYRRLAAPIEAIGEARGEAIGEARGEARGIQRMQEWLQRKTEAEAKNLSFTEPPPVAPPLD